MKDTQSLQPISCPQTSPKKLAWMCVVLAWAMVIIMVVAGSPVQAHHTGQGPEKVYYVGGMGSHGGGLFPEFQWFYGCQDLVWQVTSTIGFPPGGIAVSVGGACNLPLYHGTKSTIWVNDMLGFPGGQYTHQNGFWYGCINDQGESQDWVLVQDHQGGGTYAKEVEYDGEDCVAVNILLPVTASHGVIEIVEGGS